jgi:hypothetical protein
MSLVEISDFIKNVGFPVAACVFFFWMQIKNNSVHGKYIEQLTRNNDTAAAANQNMLILNQNIAAITEAVKSLCEERTKVA